MTKKSTVLTLLLISLLIFTACHTKDNATPISMAEVYYNYLISSGGLETERGSIIGGGFELWDVNDLYYYLDDFNGDGTMDLAVSAEENDSNGIELYTYEDGHVKAFASKGMPFSAGNEICTLAKYNDIYGLKQLRENSMGDFSFLRINRDGSIETEFEGCLYDIDGNALDTSATYEKITPVTFYNIEELKEQR